MRSLSTRLISAAAILAVSVPLAACNVEVQPAPVAVYHPPPPAVVYRPAPPPPPVVIYRPVPVYTPPPPLRYEPPPPPPPQGTYIWQPGHWDWTGNGYAWHHGQYVYRQPAYHVWVHGHMAPQDGGWVWVPGHWS